jgi:gamma-glutamyl:cysteine ligase YbdK (ATP-grasp superfamily)
VSPGFDAGAGRTVGVEEELMLVDGETLECVPRVAEVLAAAQATELHGHVKT